MSNSDIDSVQQQFVGTRTVGIQSKTDTKRSFQGMVAVFTKSTESTSVAQQQFPGANDDNNNNNNMARILITDGSDSFEGTIHVDQIKGVQWKETENTVQHKMNVVLSYILDDKKNPSIKVTFDLETNPSRCIRLEVTRRTEKGMFVRVCSTVLNQKTVGVKAGIGGGSILFCQELAAALQQQRRHVMELEDDMKKVQRDVQVWKDTAIKHEQALQRRSDELLQNFLILYRATHDRRREAEQQIQRSTDKSDSNGGISADVNESTSRSKRVLPSHDQTTVPTCPDDNDVEMYDPDTVTKLASKGRTTKRTKPAAKTKVKEAPQRKRRKNDASTAKEDSDTEELIVDEEPTIDEEEETPPELPKKRQTRSAKAPSQVTKKGGGKNEKKPPARASRAKTQSTDESALDGEEPRAETSVDTETRQPPEPAPHSAPEATDNAAVAGEEDDDEYMKQWVRENIKRNNPSQTATSSELSTEPASSPFANAATSETTKAASNDDLDDDDDAQAMIRWVRENIKRSD